MMTVGGAELHGRDDAVVVAEDSGNSSGAADETASPAGPEQSEPGPEQKRTYARLFARIWLPVLLLLIVFVVLLMVVTRHLRLWVLGRHGQVKFGPTEDLWWNPPADPPRPAGKTEDSENDKTEPEK